MIIGFCGLKGAGKDTAADYLVKNYDFEKVSFAAPMKRAVAALFDIPLHEIENFKNADNVHVAVGYKNQPTAVFYPGGKQPVELDAVSGHPSNMWSPISEFTFRQMLQRFGTEMGRENFGREFWIDLTLPVGSSYTGRKIVVSDVRFPNECDRIHELGGHVAFVDRPGLIADDHPSEDIENLDVDYVLYNNSTIEHLYDYIEDLLVSISS